MELAGATCSDVTTLLSSPAHAFYSKMAERSSHRQDSSDDVCHPLPLGGYLCNFVETPPAQYDCPVCLLPLRQPHILSCCGKKICWSCIQPIISASKPCPLCQQPFHSMLEKELERTILGFKVYCSHKDEGCDWVGELRDLDRHLSTGPDGQCMFVEVECLHGCGQHFNRASREKHERDECVHRPVEVQITSLRSEMVALGESLKKFYAAKVDSLEKTVQAQQAEIDNLKMELAVLKIKGTATKRNPNNAISFADGRILVVKKTNIAVEVADVIVNSTDGKLVLHGGVPGALNQKSLGELQRSCDAYRKEHGELPVGSSLVTSGGGNLGCKHVIHAISPNNRSCSTPEATLKEIIYELTIKILQEAEKLTAVSIVFPAIGAGRYHVKPDISAAAIVQAILDYKYTDSNCLKDIRIVTINNSVYDSFTKYFVQANSSQQQ